MKFFRYPEDKIPVALMSALLALDFVVYSFATSYLQLFTWLLIVALPKACICSWNHHHQHLPTFFQKPLNRLLELGYALHTGITTNAWVLHHNLGHHLNYLDQTKDESGWKRRDGTTMGEVEYTLKIALTGYFRAFKVGRRHPKHQREFIGMTLIVSLILTALVYLKPRNAIFVFIIPMIAGYITTCWHTYAHHAGLDTTDPLQASHNIMHRWYNRMTGNLGFHTAHHMKPGLHWSKLPEFHATIASQIPKELFVQPCFPFRLFPCPYEQMEMAQLQKVRSEAISSGTASN